MSSGSGDGGPNGSLARRIARLSRPDFGAWRRQVARVGYCSRPVRVSGESHAFDTGSGEVLASFHSGTVAEGAVLLPCGDRRAGVCPACAEVYRRDSWYLVAAGLAGKDLADTHQTTRGATATAGLPSTLAEHPMVWATLTAPSFGPVHLARAGKPCRPRRAGGRCAHGRPVGCTRRHGDSDPAVGTALCRTCYDYAGSVLRNAVAGRLWHCTSVYTYRAPARLGSALAGEHLTATGVRRCCGCRM